ncbi:hypothetical protein BJX70DRAFT_363137 [Aspergillus crustosus]
MSKAAYPVMGLPHWVTPHVTWASPALTYTLALASPLVHPWAIYLRSLIFRLNGSFKERILSLVVDSAGRWCFEV